jgi:hypothetical protein
MRTAQPSGPKYAAVTGMSTAPVALGEQQTGRDRAGDGVIRPREAVAAADTAATGPGIYDRLVPALWNPQDQGVLRLPSGRVIRGRGLRQEQPEGPDPAFDVYLLGKPPPAMALRSRPVNADVRVVSHTTWMTL